MPYAVTPRITLGDDEVSFSFLRASGAGGQNVQKVESAVQLRFPAATSPSLPEPVRERLLRLAGRRLSSGGEIVITAQRHRTQLRNREDALERLFELIREAATPPPPPRRPTRPTKGSKERRLTAKGVRASVKQGRARIREE
ncbi:MAG TPA: alternative ribosome rescue aminoacyl-tRNA hydrolase ArfB [Roseomonas sp.]